ncbi:MAG: heme ABC exporter ATP-binding protein CcmA [Gammaproteobacteria bacterium]|nr:heme ABC exporter ATP-binding protein CcmA [Gammaproteobacteria bacterium]MDH5275339.1 heme ABC exporter ATP-binding protein CcmA [Gammaproteobacteria bacterium]
MLAGTNLTLWRETTRLFEGLSFILPPGSALLIEGPNGAGKTTLLRVIAGLTMPESGSVTWNGTDLRSQLQSGVLQLAFFGHATALKPEISARANLQFFAQLAGQPARVDELLQVTGLAACADLDVRLLSAGQKRRAALARVLLSGAGLWLLDEPQTNLDKAGRQLLQRAVQTHLGGGGTVVVAAHQALDLGSAPVCRLMLGMD